MPDWYELGDGVDAPPTSSDPVAMVAAKSYAAIFEKERSSTIRTSMCIQRRDATVRKTPLTTISSSIGRSNMPT